MPVLTREALLNSKDCEPQTFVSEVWGGDIKFRAPKVKDKRAARNKSMVLGEDEKPEVDNQRLETALIIICSLDPKLEPQDIEALEEKNGNEVTKLANAILGRTALNPRK